MKEPNEYKPNEPIQLTEDDIDDLIGPTDEELMMIEQEELDQVVE